ncbi:C3a anaphylatoxin chemotactic receptor [Galemys pyrenaicus]|uniref:C3a anaphylatoxin chemotactic receptor n=1 Tax=Galemys pyrenaicus TaxID=202257 RepID=A0A8J6AGR0_GALPY|nr:C3a anaphylatoxin chemotactic receptor [Galemys pyrenaicus]
MGSFSETNATALALAGPHWMQPRSLVPMVLLGLTFLLGVPGNGLVLWVAGLRMRRTVNTVWFLHLTLADFLCCLSLPFSLAHLALQEHWPYGRLLCKLLPSVILLNMFASVFLLTAISLDRCLLVLRPVWCQNHRRVRTASAACGCIWAAALVLCVPVFVYRDVATTEQRSSCYYNFEGHGAAEPADYGPDAPGPEAWNLGRLPGPQSPAPQGPGPSLPADPAELAGARPTHAPLSPADPAASAVKGRGRKPLDDAYMLYYSDYGNFSLGYGREPWLDYNDSQAAHGPRTPAALVGITLSRLLVGFVLPTALMTACYGLIIFRMRRGRLGRVRRKTLWVAVAVVLVFLVCWAPYHVFGVLLLYADTDTPFGEALLTWDSVSIALASANSCFNPFLYALLGKDFRRQARQSLQGILEAAFSEEATHHTGCTPSKALPEKASSSTAV